MAHRPWEQFRKIATAQKLPIFALRLGSEDLVVVNSQDMADRIFVRHALGSASRGVSMNMRNTSSDDVPPPLGSSPWNSRTQAKRTVVSTLLGKSNMSRFDELIAGEVSRAVSAFTSSKNRCIDPFDTLKLFSLNMSVGVSWGLTLDPDAGDAALIREMIDVEGYIEHARYPLSLLDMLPLARYWVPLLPSHARKAAEMRGWMQRRAAYLATLSERLEACRRDGLLYPCAHEYMESSENVRLHLAAAESNSVLVSLLSAGLDAITWSVYWLLLYLAQNPTLQEELVQAMRDAHYDPRHDAGGDAVPPLVDSVVRESLRFFTVNRLSIPRVAYQDIHLGSVYIPKGTTILMNSWSINRDPSLWRNANEFDPRRFLPETRSHYAFGAERRSCPGQHIAHKQLCALVAALVDRFELRLPADMELDPVSAVVDPWALASTPKRTEIQFTRRTKTAPADVPVGVASASYQAPLMTASVS